MTHSNRNFALAYLFLVAVPVIGLTGILRSGRGLAAPISVNGTWKIQADANALAALPCGKLLAGEQATALVIAQSGKNFTLNLRNSPQVRGSGGIVGTAIAAKMAIPAGVAMDATCSGRALSLVATVDPKAKPWSLEGSTTVEDCATCKAARFHAIREDQDKTPGGH